MDRASLHGDASFSHDIFELELITHSHWIPQMLSQAYHTVLDAKHADHRRKTSLFDDQQDVRERTFVKNDFVSQ